jgi:hypothetical protein
MRSAEALGFTRLHFFMFLLYLDDSGSAGNANEKYLVLGGVCLFESQVGWVTQELHQLALNLSPNDPDSVEFHAADIFSGREQPWSNLRAKEERIGVIKQVLGIFAKSYQSARAFACAVHKDSYLGRDPMEMAFEDLCSRFDLFLKRLYASGDRQKGIIILDKTSYETSLQKLSRNFRTLGTQWNVIRNLADTPLFVDSKASRVVQLADHIAYAVFRRYEHGDSSYFDIISNRFDAEDGRIHGLCHLHNQTQTCMCPACMSRRLSLPRIDLPPLQPPEPR